MGVETVIADDPALTVRLAGYVGGQPVRVVLDSRLRIPPDSRLVTTADRIPTIVISTRSSNKRLTDAGVRLIQVAETDGRVDALAVVRALEELGVASVMIEGGGQVAASFVSRGLVDAVEWFRAPMVLGEEGRPAIAAFVLKDLAAAPRFHRTEVQSLGDDLWERYEKA